MLDVEVYRDAERRGSREGECERLAGDAAKLTAKLANASFVQRAPAAVVEQDRTRLADSEARLSDLRSQLAKLG